MRVDGIRQFAPPAFVSSVVSEIHRGKADEHSLGGSQANDGIGEGEIGFVGLGEITWRGEWLVTVAVGGGADGEFVLEEVDVDGVEALGLAIGEIGLRFRISEINDQGLCGVALDAEGFAVLIDEVAAIAGDLDGISVGGSSRNLFSGRKRRKSAGAGRIGRAPHGQTE